ncbi:CGNR zinc finger domain-containing protein [Actinacidiphila bryophytorum]|uniref:CGNR zinc finger domain-containing protein n=1 Tax=Actinacidiphila bryophytorum TaxID=1436133 RepID=UPI002176DA50|nr:ABATE domain-containing protein [Actinacidiphila bryophytorum]UWE08230.1 ABATE domain-containing protein [Actinacidiphila bryophytorum]
MGELRFDGGRVCLDLVATRVARPVGERLDRAERVVEWAYGTGLVPPGTPVDADAAWTQGLTDLRTLLEALVGAQLTGAPPPQDAVARLNDLARVAPPAPQAVPAADGTLTRALAAPPDAAGLLAAVARDAVDLFTDPVARSQLRRCEGENCALVYLDTSRGRRRRWCSSEVCGNRERVARHRRRTAPALRNA